jgi:hypothetical protein
MTENAETPYRSSGPLEKLATPPTELVYQPGDAPKRGEAIRRAAGVVWLGGPVSLMVGGALGRFEVTVALFTVTLALAAWRWKRTRTATRVVLRVDEGMLFAARVGGAGDTVSIPVSQIRNVRLETKTIEKLQTDRTIGVFIVSSSVRPAIDVSRLVVVPSKSWGSPFVLDETFEPNFEAVQWLGKVRTFLRAYGWVPADERRKSVDAGMRPAASTRID